MKIYLCNYANENFLNKQSELNEIERSVKEFDGVFSYNEDWLKETEFYKNNYFILSQQRGAGYWLWKPYIILESLKQIEYGDAIFYIDSGDRYSSGIRQELINHLEYNNECLVPGGFINEMYTKMDCFYYMDCLDEKYFKSVQLEAGTVAFKKTEKSINLLNEWIYYCKDYKVLTDSNNECGMLNKINFIDHRHDQSILTNLAIKHGMSLNKNLRKYIINNV